MAAGSPSDRLQNNTGNPPRWLAVNGDSPLSSVDQLLQAAVVKIHLKENNVYTHDS